MDYISAIYKSSEDGHKSLLQALLQSGHNIPLDSVRGGLYNMTALHTAAGKGHADCVQLMLEGKRKEEADSKFIVAISSFSVNTFVLCISDEMFCSVFIYLANCTSICELQLFVCFRCLEGFCIF